MFKMLKYFLKARGKWCLGVNKSWWAGTRGGKRQDAADRKQARAGWGGGSQPRKEGQYRSTGRDEGQVILRLFDNTPRNLMALYLHKVMHNICTYAYTSISGAAEGGKQLLVLTSCQVWDPQQWPAWQGIHGAVASGTHMGVAASSI